MRESEKPKEEKSAVLGWMDGSINVIEIALQHITGCINIKENISIHHAFTLPLFDQSLSKTFQISGNNDCCPFGPENPYLLR